MPRGSKRRNQAQSALSHRWSSAKVSSSSESFSEEYSMDTDDEELPFNEKLCLTDSDVAEMCKSKCDMKYLSTLLYMSLRFFNTKWEDVDEYLKSIGFMTPKTSHKSATVFIKGDYEKFLNDLRKLLLLVIFDVALNETL
ncbi:unnamed protein product [Didymodactylos carnosus]|uniref:Uncharacterized protein n=1 Tax=Didymodactylos carnosus TaxID=1234261 RepID=A0A8S2DY17_9BILA|nr:unnamed protein product [Didymodactylos carnosus]CAF3830531.1 unnamed protein product [Didymodactylos carnosus]